MVRCVLLAHARTSAESLCAVQVSCQSPLRQHHMWDWWQAPWSSKSCAGWLCGRRTRGRLHEWRVPQVSVAHPRAAPCLQNYVPSSAKPCSLIRATLCSPGPSVHAARLGLWAWRSTCYLFRAQLPAPDHQRRHLVRTASAVCRCSRAHTVTPRCHRYLDTCPSMSMFLAGALYALAFGMLLPSLMIISIQGIQVCEMRTVFLPRLTESCL